MALHRTRIFKGALTALLLGIPTLADGLSFDFSEGSGATTTDSIRGAIGLLGDGSQVESEPVWTTDTPSGKAGDFALSFNMSPSTIRQFVAVDLTDQPLNLAPDSVTNFTLQAWVKIPSRLNTDRMVIFRTSGAGPRVSLSINNNRTLHTTVFGNTDFTSSVAVPNDNRWHHVAVVMENNFGRVRFYLDGVSRQTVNRTATGAATSSGSEGLSIGLESSTRYFTGLLDRVKLDNVSLTAEELDSQAVPGLPTFASFDSHPVDRVVDLGETAIFTASPTIPDGDSMIYWRHRLTMDQAGMVLPNTGGANAELTLANVTAASRGFYSLVVSNAAGVVESYPARLDVRTAPNTLQRLWELVPGDRDYITPYSGDAQTRDLERGMAYNPVTDHLLIGARFTSPLIKGIYIIDADTGAHVGELGGSSAITNGTIVLTRVGVADDGAIYACNFGTLSDTNPLKIYRWASETASEPTLAYLGNPVSGISGNQQWGKNMIVRGAGANTQILMDTRTALLALFTTADGENFTPTILTSDAVDDSGAGMAWGQGNSYWGKSLNEPLFRWDINTEGQFTEELETYAAAPGPQFMNFGFSEDYNYLAGLVVQSGPDAVELYDFSNKEAGPVLLDSETFTTDNTHSVVYGNVYIRGNRVFALNPNNGIIAFSINTGGGTTPSLSISKQGTAVLISWPASATGFRLQGTSSLTSPNWEDISHQTVDDENRATVEASGSARFFRLVKN